MSTSARTRTRARSRSPSHERGIAMLLVLVGLALLALVANELSYNAMVEMRLATNQRDEVRAHFLAESGINLSRLVLKFQKQVDQIQIPNISGLLGNLPPGIAQALGLPPELLAGLGGAGGAGAGGLPGLPGMPGAGGPSSMSIQL